MKLLEISQSPEDEQLPTTVAEYIKKYDVKTGAYLKLEFKLPNMVTSWQGTPNMVYELKAGGTKLASFDGLNLLYTSALDLLNCPMQSYKNIHKHVRECSSVHVYRHGTHMLGLFRCVTKSDATFPNRIRLYGFDNTLDRQATELFNKLHKEMSDIYQIQEALIDAGYEEQAQP